jgi:predicted nucleotidyltransferase
MRTTEPASTSLDRFMADLRPLLVRQDAVAAWVFGSHARGEADPHSDIDIIIVAPTDRPAVDRFLDYLPAIAHADVGVDMLVYTPEEFDALRHQRLFLVHVMEEARCVYER